MSTSPDGNYDELYYRHKLKEIKVSNDIFPGQNWKEWSLRRQLQELKKVAPSLTRIKRNSIIQTWEQAGKDRKEFASIFFPYQPKDQRYRHDWYHTTFLKWCIEVLKEWASPITETPEAIVSQQVETLQNLSIKQKETPEPASDTGKEALDEEVEILGAEILDKTSDEANFLDKTSDEANFLYFLEDLERLVDQAVDLWRRVAAGHLRLATAANLTFTIVRTIRSVVHAESLRNESWFEFEKGLLATCKDLEYSFGKELERGGPTWINHMLRVTNPPHKAGLRGSPQLSAIYMLLKPYLEGRLKGPHKKDLATRVELAATATIFNRCDDLHLDLNDFRKSVEARIADCEALAQYVQSHPTERAFANLSDLLSMIPALRQWAEACQIALGFGVMMNWLEIDIVKLRRIFTYENSGLQCFAYICEIDRIKEKPTSKDEDLRIELDKLFDDPRVTPFLFLSGRPKTITDCSRGVENWADPSSVRETTAHSLQVRDKPTVSQQISWGNGFVERNTSGQYNGRTLEQHLEWELGFTDPVHFERCLIEAASSVVLIKNRLSLNTTTLYYYLKSQVLWNPKKQKQLLAAFIDRWSTNGGDEGGTGSPAPSEGGKS